MSNDKKCCLKCGIEVENDDNFCRECGHWTAKGYKDLTEQPEKYKKILDGKIAKRNSKLTILFITLVICMFLAVGMIFIRGQNILKPIIYIKRQVMTLKYGYNTTILKTNNNYTNVEIFNNEDAYEMIENDLNNQKWQCKNYSNMNVIENELQTNLNIPSIIFCDMAIEEAKKISSTIQDIYGLFPQIEGYLTNISVTNPIDKEAYVANFQPLYEFVNSYNNTLDYNKVNKTQILLNSYYFLNLDTLKKPVKENWYIEDATWESLIAHEFGHYITFVALLKTSNMESVLIKNEKNENNINELINVINSGSFSEALIQEAINNYNAKYNTSLSKEEFAENISNYANNSNISDEIISESVHDYYLHRNNAKKESLEVINVLYTKLN